MGGGLSTCAALRPRWARTRPTASWSVTKTTMLMRLPQRVQRSGSTWYAFAIGRAQLGDKRRRAGVASAIVALH